MLLAKLSISDSLPTLTNDVKAPRLTEDRSPPALFFYGSLLDAELFECVLGAPLTAITHERAWLKDHFVSGIVGLPYPMLAPQTNSHAEGIVVDGLTQTQFDRVRYYEGIDYDLTPLDVQTDNGARRVKIFTGAEQHSSDGTPWSLTTWQRATKALSIAVMSEIAPYIGTESLDEVEDRWNETERRLIKSGMANHEIAPWPPIDTQEPRK